MIKANEIKLNKFIDSKKEINASLIADTKDEVIAIGNDASTVKGLNSECILAMGSTCLCVNGDFGILGSNGQWKF